MAPKREDLAQRFGQRLKQAPARGAIVDTPTRPPLPRPDVRPTRPANPVATPPPAVARPRPAQPPAPAARAVPPAPKRIGRGAVGHRLRGHLVPRQLHGDARRRKLRLEAEQQRRITWEEVVTEALELLLAQRSSAASLVEEVRTMSERANAGRRLLQSTIPSDIDRKFSELRLDLSDAGGRDVSYELLWASALLLWVRAG